MMQLQHREASDVAVKSCQECASKYKLVAGGDKQERVLYEDVSTLTASIT